MTDPEIPAGRHRVLLGFITTVHGIRGDLVVNSFTANPKDIAGYKGLETKDGKPLGKLSVVRVTDRGVIARLAGVTTRTQAEAFRGTEIWIDRAQLPRAAENEYYHADLIGLDAVSADQTLIGTVIAVENFGAGDLLEVRLAGSNETEYIPFTNACVPVVDIAARRLVIVRPEFAEAEGDDDGEAEPR